MLSTIFGSMARRIEVALGSIGDKFSRSRRKRKLRMFITFRAVASVVVDSLRIRAASSAAVLSVRSRSDGICPRGNASWREA